MTSTIAELYGENHHVYALYQQGFRKGINGNYKLTGRNSNLFRNAPMKIGNAPISKYTKAGKFFSKLTFAGGFFLDATGVYNYYKYGADSPNAVHPAKAITNTGIGVYSLYSVEFGPAGLIYTAVDVFYPGGWTGDKEHEGAIRKIAGMHDRNKAALGDSQPFFNLHRDPCSGGL